MMSLYSVISRSIHLCGLILKRSITSSVIKIICFIKYIFTHLHMDLDCFQSWRYSLFVVDQRLYRYDRGSEESFLDSFRSDLVVR